MGKDLITILLPVHNDERYLGHCLESLKNQSHPEFKCLVGFNGTKDRSKDIFKDLVGKDSRFLDLDYGVESGKSITLNKMLKEVQTEITCLIDGDDMWHSDKLRRQIKRLGEADVIGTLTTYINEDNIPGHRISLYEISEAISHLILEGHNQIINSSCFVKTDCFREVGGWDPAVEGLEDYDVWVKMAHRGKTFYNIQEGLTYHRIHSSSNFNSKRLPLTPMDILIRNKQEQC
jgi:glycosyltransferase involved in cell wall biosynthesis